MITIFIRRNDPPEMNNTSAVTHLTFVKIDEMAGKPMTSRNGGKTETFLIGGHSHVTLPYII